MIRFLQYALEHERKIRAVFYLDQKMVQKNIYVKAFDEQTVSITIGAKKQIVTLSMEDILSCDYARGDRGEL